MFQGWKVGEVYSLMYLPSGQTWQMNCCMRWRRRKPLGPFELACELTYQLVRGVLAVYFLTSVANFVVEYVRAVGKQRSSGCSIVLLLNLVKEICFCCFILLRRVLLAQPH